MRTAGYIIAVLAAIVLTGCEKELEFKYRDIAPLTVIEGSLTDSEVRVGITLTTPMDKPMDRTRLTDAEVMLADVTSGATVGLTSDESGYFVTPTGGVTGHVYELTVRRQGATYRATSVMQAPTRISAMEFQWIRMPYDDVAVLQVTFDDNPGEYGECYWVRLYRNGEPYKWSAVTDILAVDGHIDEVIMTSRKDIDEEDDDTVLRDGDIVTASVCRISRDMYDYLEAIGGGGSNGQPMFAGDFCLGYFLASPVWKESVTFRPDDMPLQD